MRPRGQNHRRREVVTSLQDAVDDLFRIAVTEGKSTSTSRLQKLADLCVEELARRGLDGAEGEVPVPGAGRVKRWDVAWRSGGKCRAAISLKSVLRNLGGTVPNRIDDLIGEVANAQLHSPEIVIGYIVIFNVEDDAVSPKHGTTWHDLMASRLSSLSGRGPPSWTTGMIEIALLVTVDFGTSPQVLAASKPPDRFFDDIARHVKERNPDAVEDPAPT